MAGQGNESFLEVTPTSWDVERDKEKDYLDVSRPTESPAVGHKSLVPYSFYGFCRVFSPTKQSLCVTDSKMVSNYPHLLCSCPVSSPPLGCGRNL